MSIMNTAELVRMARKEGFEEAAKIVDRESDKLMRLANKHHDAEDPDYDQYENLECQASHLSEVAARIRRKAKRS